MTVKGDAKFNGNLTKYLKNDIINLVSFHVSSQKSENLHFDGILLSTAHKVSAKKVPTSYLMTPKIEKEWTFCLRNGMRNLVNFNGILL